MDGQVRGYPGRGTAAAQRPEPDQAGDDRDQQGEGDGDPAAQGHRLGMTLVAARQVQEAEARGHPAHHERARQCQAETADQAGEKTPDERLTHACMLSSWSFKRLRTSSRKAKYRPEA